MSRFPRFTAAAIAAAALVTIACGDEPAEISVNVPAARPAVVTTSASATPDITPPVRSVSASYDDGEAAYRAGQYTDAMIIFSAYADLHSQNAFGHYMLGLSSWKAGEPARALEAFERALALDSNHVKSLLNSSRVLLDLKRPDEAIARIDRVLQQDSNNVDGLRLLARAYHNQGDHEAAVSAYKRTLSVSERDVWSLNNLGLLYIEAEADEAAIGPLARAVEIRGNAPVFHNNLGAALERTGRTTQARAQYEAALAVDSTYRKAATSLERIAGLSDAEPADSVDLGMKASEFTMTIRSWGE